MSPCEILIQSTRLDNAEESHEHRRVFPSEEIGSSRTAWWWTSDAGIIQVGSHFSIKFVSGFFPAGRGLKKAVAPKQGKWLTVIFGYLIHLVLPNPVDRYCGFETIFEINRFFFCLSLAGVYFCGFAIFYVLLEIDFCDFQTVPVPSIDNMFVIFGNLFLRIAGKSGAKTNKFKKSWLIGVG